MHQNSPEDQQEPESPRQNQSPAAQNEQEEAKEVDVIDAECDEIEISDEFPENNAPVHSNRLFVANDRL